MAQDDSPSFCDSTLFDVVGGAAIGATATSMIAADSVAVSMATLAVAGESGLVVVGAAATIISSPAVATGATIAAAAGAVGYVGARSYCALDEWLADTHITNGSIPIYLLEGDLGWFEAVGDAIVEGNLEFTQREVRVGWATYNEIPPGIPIFAEQYLDDEASALAPNSNGRGMIVAAVGDLLEYRVVIPANFLNTIYRPSDTHIFMEDTVVYDAMNEEEAYPYTIPSGHTFELIRERDGWYKIELSDTGDYWLPSLESTESIEDFLADTALALSSQ